MRLIHALTFALFGLLGGCGGKSDSGSKPEVINRYGTYAIEPGASFMIDEENHLLRIVLIKGGVSTPLAMRHGDASALMNWVAYWDDRTKRLWLLSSDIGGFYWDWHEGQFGEQQAVDSSEALKQAFPAEVCSFLTLRSNR
jgi:hypothetical protein